MTTVTKSAMTTRATIAGEVLPQNSIRNAHPILFSDPMVRAILKGQKTQTRRLAHFVPREPGLNLGFSGLQVADHCAENPASGAVLTSRRGDGCWEERTFPLKCKYGVVGDLLYVRESWAPGDREAVGDVHDREMAEYIWWRADDSLRGIDGRNCAGPHLARPARWRPSIHLPKACSRIWLRVTEIRVERLQRIVLGDARSEGIPQTAGEAMAQGFPAAMYTPGYAWDNRTSAENFACLWDSINSKRDGASWQANPWVWVVCFERIPTPEPALLAAAHGDSGRWK